MKVLLAGCSGLIGTALKRHLADQGHVLAVLVRRPVDPSASITEYQWHPDVAFVPGEAIEWADAVVGMSGAPVGRLPWTQSYRRTLLSSRVNTTRALALAINKATNPPNVWVNGSAVGFYGNRPGELLTEQAPAGTGFLAGVCAQWESETQPATDVTRLVIARTGIVLSPEGQLKPLIRATKLGLATTIGTGNQYWPWVSLADVVGALTFLLDQDCKIAGPVNIAGPQGATAAELTQALAKAYSRPNFLKVPGGLVRAIMKDPAEDLLLVDQHVVPEALEQAGYQFEDQTVTDAVG